MGDYGSMKTHILAYFMQHGFCENCQLAWDYHKVPVAVQTVSRQFFWLKRYYSLLLCYFSSAVANENISEAESHHYEKLLWKDWKSLVKQLVTFFQKLRGDFNVMLGVINNPSMTNICSVSTSQNCFTYLVRVHINKKWSRPNFFTPFSVPQKVL